MFSALFGQINVCNYNEEIVGLQSIIGCYLAVISEGNPLDAEYGDFKEKHDLIDKIRYIR